MAALKAKILSLEAAILRGFPILLDTNVLSFAFNGSNERVCAAFHNTPRNKLFTTELVRWEFLRGGILKREERQARRDWIKERQIRFAEPPPKGYHATFQTFFGVGNAPRDPVDVALVAHAVACGGQVFIATHNGKDFSWNPNITLILDYLPPGTTTP